MIDRLHKIFLSKFSLKDVYICIYDISTIELTLFFQQLLNIINNTRNIRLGWFKGRVSSDFKQSS